MLFFCCSFWLSFAAFNLIQKQFYFIPGVLCNAAATIANDAHMPSSYDMTHKGIYVALTPDSALPFLCDIYGGTSIGDFLLFAGLIFFGVSMWRKSRSTTKLVHS
jgi:hypothetical protein